MVASSRVTGPVVCGLDLGSTTAQGVLVDAAGRVVASRRAKVAVRFPRPGWVEHDPDGLVGTARRLLEDLGGLDVAPVALGIVTQRATVVAWDAVSGEALGPAISWQDRRTSERVAGLLADGVLALDSALAPKAWWLLRHLDTVGAAARAGRLRLGPVDAWLAARLAGPDAAVTDAAQASATLLFEATSGTWDAAASEAHGVPVEALVPVVDTVGAVGSVDLGGRRVAVTARSGDQSGSCVALGVTRPGRAKISLGTSGMLDEHTGTTPGGGGGTYPVVLWARDGITTFAREGVIHSAGSTVEWLVGLGLLDDPRRFDEVAGSVDDSGGVWFVPALAGLGAPHHDDTARGRFEGLSRATGRAELVRAVLEGLAHRVVDLVEAVGATGPLRVDGGLAASRLLVRRVADLSGRPVEVARDPATAAVGAAHLAAVGAGLAPFPDDGGSLVEVDVVRPGGTDPHGERRRWYELLGRRPGTTA